MIKIKGNKLIITGKDEKWVRREAKKLKITPQKLLDMFLTKVFEDVRTLGDDILIQKVKDE